MYILTTYVYDEWYCTVDFENKSHQQLFQLKKLLFLAGPKEQYILLPYSRILYSSFKNKSFFKIMRPINVHASIKHLTYFSITLACFAFVFWQSVQCIQKYVTKPQGTKLSLQHTSEVQQFPAITICAKWSDIYDKDHLKRCGLR